jgi:arginine deiminase
MNDDYIILPIPNKELAELTKQLQNAIIKYRKNKDKWNNIETDLKQLKKDKNEMSKPKFREFRKKLLSKSLRIVNKNKKIKKATKKLKRNQRRISQKMRCEYKNQFVSKTI